ncbi:spermine/spermidine synthase family protein [Lineolata rhizophorae]|uniref:Spermine/spermidine synthase family protein n=1 Tax=Lineolata rhizophorae TaxID=578093 RepID=A0A6A6NQX5_9PEZI|nr:spermine/spermidine synthase family protein [Lineolata rhizophorae]
MPKKASNKEVAKRSQGAPAPPPPAPPTYQPVSPAKAIFYAVAFLVLAAISSPVSQYNLSPVYGTLPSYIFHHRGTLYAALLGFMLKHYLYPYLPRYLHNVLPIVAYWIPVIQFYLFSFSSTFGPVWGPLITEICTYYPLLWLSTFSAKVMLDAVDLEGVNPTMAEMGPALASYMTFSFMEKAASALLPRFIGSSEFITRSGLQLIVATSYTVLCPSRWILLAIPAMLHSSRLNIHNPSNSTTALLNQQLEQQEGWRLLERRESITGYVSVLESLESGFRVMRCDHSLLGGEWLVTDERIKMGQVEPEPVYGVFELLGGIRLVELDKPIPETEKNALMIGLGIGTAPKSLIGAGIPTTIVEIDPAVHAFATSYFGLPTNHTVHLANAISFAANNSVSHPGSYDYIVHDVFTGGAEPVGLFTHEFFNDLKGMLKEETGVVAINYAGDTRLPSTQLVLNTIHSVFPACRIFRDNPPPTPADGSGAPTPAEALPHDFVNMVVFCTRSAAALKDGRMQFRRPTDAEVGKSIARRQNMWPKPELEIPYVRPEGLEAGGAWKGDERVVTRARTDKLSEGHRESVISHWKIMRTVVPAKVWEMW